MGSSRACGPRSRIQNLCALQKQTFPPHSHREQGLNNLLYTQQKMDSSTKGRGQLRLGTCLPHPRMGCGTNFTEPTATTKPRGVPTGGISYLLAPPAHARSLSFSLAQDDSNKGCSRAGGGQRGLRIKFHLSPTFLYGLQAKDRFYIFK